MRKIVTGWFRTPAIWPTLADIARGHDRPVVIWSGACGTGEEAYSAAITLHDAGIDATVIASDIDADLVDLARAARYRASALQADSVPARTMRRHFHCIDGRTYRVRSHILDRVRFDTAEMGVDTPPACDIAMVRNVWRHMTPERQRAAAEHVAHAIGHRGRIVLGGSDFLDANLVDRTPPVLLEMFTPAEHAMIQRRRATW